MNKQKKLEWYAKRLQAMVWLREAFPLLFSSDPKLLKVGIRQDIVAANKEGMPEEKWIGIALRNYVHSYAYQKRMKPGALRFDPEGLPAGEVSEEEAARAKEACNAYKKKVAANYKQIKAERQNLRDKEKKAAIAVVIPTLPEPQANISGRKILTLKKRSPDISWV